MIKDELRLVQFALMFYTRIPVPSLAHVDQETQDHASRYFPLVGWIVGCLNALVFVLLASLFPHEISILLTMCFSVLLTGAFHEDGMADACDGLGGGWDKQTILTIMKDSRVGTYGLVGLGAVLALKYAALANMPHDLVVAALIAGHVISRWYSSLVMWLMDYVVADEASKAKPITKGFEDKDFAIASITIVPVLFVLPYDYYFACILASLPLFYFCRKLKRWLGGYTGDTLGAAQQLTEVAFYLAVVALL